MKMCKKIIDIYIVIMYRYGDKENHAYPLCMAKSYIEAELIGTLHGLMRGQKYCHNILVEKSKPEFHKLVQFSDEKETNQFFEYIYSSEMLNDFLADISEMKYCKIHDLEFNKWDVESIKNMNYYYSYFSPKIQEYIRDISEQYIRSGRI